jgi:hypothetical protein
MGPTNLKDPKKETTTNKAVCGRKTFFLFTAQTPSQEKHLIELKSVLFTF